MQLVDFKHPYLSLYLTALQKRFLLEIATKNSLRLNIFRNSISLNRLATFYKKLSENDRKALQTMFSKSLIRTGHSKIITVPFNLEPSPALCELYGYLTGDGSMLKVCRFYNSEPTIISRVNTILGQLFGAKLKFERRTDYFIPKIVQVILEEIFGRKGLSRHAQVPDMMHALHKQCVKNYIRALFDSDGTIGGNPPTLASRSFKLVEGINILLYSKFGIKSHIRTLPNGKDFELVIGTGKRSTNFPHLLRFYEEIGFLHSQKAKRLARNLCKRGVYRVLDAVRTDYATAKEISSFLNLNNATVNKHLNNLARYEMIHKDKVPGKNQFQWIV
jgi:hypothetical protein